MIITILKAIIYSMREFLGGIILGLLFLGGCIAIAGDYAIFLVLGCMIALFAIDAMLTE